MNFLGDVKKKMNFGMMGGFDLPLIAFWKAENIKLERAFNFAKEESKEISTEG